ncbi:hypothetical protein [Rahnella sp. PAMC 25559]|uniref:hypothetical protein n=1 Tax=Rahnella sp. PAMC 25559 TaxID=3423225 RepID=UPI003D678DC7
MERKIQFWKIFIIALFCMETSGCNLLNNEVIYPPPYIGIPIEISTFEVKGLKFVETVRFTGISAMQKLIDYTNQHNNRYFVVIYNLNSKASNEKKISAMIYK